MTEWLLGTLLATSGLIALVLLLREPVRSHFGARVAYGLWLIPAARLFMPTLTETVVRPVAVSAASGVSVAAESEPSFLVQIGGWHTVLIALWATGALAFFLVQIVRFRRQRLAILAAGTDVDRAGSIRIVKSAAVTGPVAFGIVDRVIAVPEDFERRYNEHERRLALDHELAHHRSGDLIANFVAFVLLCLQWFNPLAWIAHAAFRFDQEAACDARVLDKADRSNRADYGRAIAKAASGRALLLASALDQRGTLRRRLKCMLSNPTSGRCMAGRLIVTAALAAALPLTATRAIVYVDVPATRNSYQPASLTPRPPLAREAAERPVQFRSESGIPARSGRPGFTPAPIPAESRMTAEELRTEAEALSNAAQQENDEERAARDAARMRERAARDAAQAQREKEHAARDAARAQERTDREAARAVRDREFALRDAARVQERAARDAARSQQRGENR